MKKELKLSVHTLVDFLLRTGDIDNRVYNKATMAEGSNIHRFYQSKQGGMYLSEVLLSECFEVNGFKVTLEGRADGIILNNGEATIDEIKTTIMYLEDYYNEQKEWHLGQAKCYALMFAHLKHLDKIDVQLTYISQVNDDKMKKSFSFSSKQLEEDIENLIKEYLDFYVFIFERTNKRNLSAKNLDFPFREYRKGQRKLAKYAYGIARDGGVLFCEAPTGIGKTISTLYPFIKSFAEEKNDKIFYLTAKNSGKEAAFQTVANLVKNGLEATDILITAKDKICYCPGKACNPDECPYAKGYYTKIRKVLTDSIKQYNCFSTERILSIASSNGVCPFELSLDLSLFVDIIICDYNYFFDPMVYLKRYFDEDATNMLVLVDEAHNLVERGRNMYSAYFSSHAFKEAKKSVKGLEHSKYKKAVNKVNKIFKLFDGFPEGDSLIENIDPILFKGLEDYLLASTDINKHHHEYVNDAFTEFFFEVNKFFKLLDFFDDSFCIYICKNGKEVTIHLLCLDPSDRLRRTLQLVRGKIIFSATLSPVNYYIGMIGGSENDPMLMLPSPFPPENLCLMIAPTVSIKYKNRDATLQQVADYIIKMVSGKIGNYFVYVPSYEYLAKLMPFLDFGDDVNVLVQEKDMEDNDKRDFLSLFVEKPTQTTVGVAIVGGAFGEGIDLVSERLIGVAVVGVGLPQICFERDRIREYFDKTEKKGYEYSYINPGMNKVMQAVGRVIRSETDKGVALLIDDRYLSATYRDLFKNEWNNYKVVTSPEDVKEQVDKFWKD